MPTFRISLRTGKDLGEVHVASQTWRPGDTLFRGNGPNLRVLEVIDPEGEDSTPLLIVEQIPTTSDPSTTAD